MDGTTAHEVRRARPRRASVRHDARRAVLCRRTHIPKEPERVFYRSWLNVGREDQIPQPGGFLTREVGDESGPPRVRAYETVAV